MSTPYPFPQPLPPQQAPMVPPRPTRTVDVIVTSFLVVTHIAVLGVSAFFSLFYAMASDPCFTGVACDEGKIGQAYLVTDVAGLVVLVVACVGAVVLMVRRRVAFWVPLVGIGVQVLLVVISFHLLDGVVP